MPEITIPAGYKILDESHVVNQNTGEVVKYTTVLLPCDGSSYITAEDKERNKLAKQERIDRAIRRDRSGEHYYFVSRDTNFEDISPASTTRLIYLSTYMRYSDNHLMLTQRTSMRRRDIAKVLGLSDRTSYSFLNEVVPRYVRESESGCLVLCDEVFKRGRMKRKEFNPYQQFYDDGVRQLYKAANGKYHKQLGYLFKLLPYISIEFNLACFNPYETDIDKVELISISEFCKIINYNVTHIDRLLNIYNTVRFDVNGRQERFCTMIYNGIDTKNAKICINPAVFYAGTNVGRLDVTRLYFRD